MAVRLGRLVGAEIYGLFCSFLGLLESSADGPSGGLALLQVGVGVNRTSGDVHCCTRQKAGAVHPRQVAGKEVAAVGEVGAPSRDGDLAIRRAALGGPPEASIAGAQDERREGSVPPEAVTEPPGCCCTEAHLHEGTRVVGVEFSAPRTQAGAGHMPAFASVPVPGHPLDVNIVAEVVPFAVCLAGHTQAGSLHIVFQGRHLR